MNKQTGIEATVEKWLLAAGAEYKKEFPISLTHVDFFLPGTKTIVEVCGCYWHCCSRCSKKDGKWTSDQIKKRKKDGRRYTFLRNAGYTVMLLWEHEIEGDPEAARKKLLNAL